MNRLIRNPVGQGIVIGIVVMVLAFMGFSLVPNISDSREVSWGVPRVEAQTEDGVAGPEFFVGPRKIIITLRLIVPPGGLAGMVVDGTTDENVSITCAPTGQPLERCTSMNTARLTLSDLSNEGVGEVVDIGFIMEGTPGNHFLFVRTIQADDDLGNVLNIPPIRVPFTLP